MRPIDADALVEDLRRQLKAVYRDTMLQPIFTDDPFVEVLAKSEGKHMQLFIRELCDYLTTRPTITPEPVKGEWIKIRDGYDNDLYVCQRCAVMCHGSYNFCPNCGADMRKEERHEHRPD